MKSVFSIGVLLFSAMASHAAAAADEFPLRARYVNVQVVETAPLYDHLDDYLVVDVRSKYEYETLHVAGAINVPIGDSGFALQIRKLRAKDAKPMVFYCNGVTCTKSYDAVLAVQAFKVDKVFAYDAGIAAWARLHPDKTVLLGKSPIKTEDLISAERFAARLIAPKDFAARAAAHNTIVLDIRDRTQRDSPLFPTREERIPMDDSAAIDSLINRARQDRKTLLIYDAVGKQVEWFQYRLEARGFKDYYFMDGGASAYFNATLGKS